MNGRLAGLGKTYLEINLVDEATIATCQLVITMNRGNPFPLHLFVILHQNLSYLDTRSHHHPNHFQQRRFFPVWLCILTCLTVCAVSLFAEYDIARHGPQTVTLLVAVIPIVPVVAHAGSSNRLNSISPGVIFDLLGVLLGHRPMNFFIMYS